MEAEFTEDANANYFLVKAVAAGLIDIVKYLLENDADIDINKGNPLKHASKNGYVDIVKYLIEKGGRSLRINAEDNMALRLSARYGHFEVFEILIKKCSPSPVDLDILLSYGAMIGNIGILKSLVENGANIRVGDDAALRCAAENGHLEIVKYLIENGADIHAQNDYALCCGALKGYLEIVKYLVKNGSDIHAQNDGALCCAAKNGHLEIVKYLVENGAEIYTGWNGALYHAGKKGHIQVVKYLIGIVFGDVKITSAELASAGSCSNQPLVVKINVRQTEKGGNICDAALCGSAQNGHFQVVKYLIEKGANISVLTNATIRELINKNVIAGEKVHL